MTTPAINPGIYVVKFENQKATFHAIERKYDLMENFKNNIFDNNTQETRSFWAGAQHADSVVIQGKKGSKIAHLEYEGAFGMVKQDILLSELCSSQVSEEEIVKELQEIGIRLKVTSK